MRSGFSFLFKKDELKPHRIASKELRIKNAGASKDFAAAAFFVSFFCCRKKEMP
jgi:hypothetical protein